MRRGLSLLLAMTLAAPGFAADQTPGARAVSSDQELDDRYPKRRVEFPDGVVGLPDLTFRTLEGYRPLRLDVYRPGAEGKRYPLVVHVHGGGWFEGHARHLGAFRNFPATLASLAARGFVVASIEYRLSSEATFPAQIEDVRYSIHWLRENAAELGIDPKRAVIWGGSAGGQLAALAAVSCKEEPECVQGLVAWYGVFDFGTIGSAQGGSRPGWFEPDSAPGRLLGCTASSCKRGIIEAASPSHFVDAKDPPVLLIHGDRDRIVPIRQSRDFYKLLRSKGVTAELVEIPSTDHGFVGATPEATRVASLQALDKTFEFITRILTTEPPPVAKSSTPPRPSAAPRPARPLQPSQ